MSDDSKPTIALGDSCEPTGPADGRTAALGLTQPQGVDPTVASELAASCALSPGTVLFGEYEIVGPLGSGGMGEVYRASHRRLDEPRAIKVIRPALAGDEGSEELFHRESKALLSIRHPAVVHCHDLLSDEGGDLFLVMELIEGISLGERLQAGPLNEEDLDALAERLSAGLCAAHAAGVVHRDLCPDNVILPGGRVGDAKIIDFGVAKCLGAPGAGTLVEGFKGKLAYASPEQLGFHGGVVDARSDSYSLGLVLCAAAAGEPLEMGRNIVEAVDARRGLRDVPEPVPAGLRHAVGKLLELHPKDRWTAQELVDETSSAPRRSSTDASRTAWLVLGAATVSATVGLVSIRTLPPTEGAAAPRVSVLESVGVPEADGLADRSDVEWPDRAQGSDRAESLRQTLQIAGLLRGARAALDDGQWLRPARTSAIDRYRAVLAADPTNDEARAGLAELAARLVQRAQTTYAAGQLQAARRDLRVAATLAPEDATVAGLRRSMKDR